MAENCCWNFYVCLRIVNLIYLEWVLKLTWPYPIFNQCFTFILTENRKTPVFLCFQGVLKWSIG